MKSWRIVGGSPLRGELTPPADKSISHRALLFGGLAIGQTEIENLLEAEDCLATARILQELGIQAERVAQGCWRVGGGTLRQPDMPLDAGNSGTTIRLLAGVLAAQPFTSVITGDESLRSRPMRRVIEPLTEMGARIESEGGSAPLTIRGGPLRGIRYESPVASAQVKSCLLLAGLFAEGETTVVEPSLSRDHTERMLPLFGAELQRDGLSVSVRGRQSLRGASIRVPADFSSAAFPLVAALLVPGSDVTLRSVGVNPTRAALAEVLPVERTPEQGSGEPVASLRSWARPLEPFDVGGEAIPRLVDEVPIMAVAATQAVGESFVRDAQELRVKESNRLATIVEELRKLGAVLEETEDGLRIGGPTPLVGASVRSHGDHRIAMSLAIAGMCASGTTIVEDVECVATSFPDFARALASLGARIEEM